MKIGLLHFYTCLNYIKFKFNTSELSKHFMCMYAISMLCTPKHIKSVFALLKFITKRGSFCYYKVGLVLQNGITLLQKAARIIKRAHLLQNELCSIVISCKVI